jgi:hypothetical protein
MVWVDPEWMRPARITNNARIIGDFNLPSNRLPFNATAASAAP